jgi:hypothetical protein
MKIDTRTKLEWRISKLVSENEKLKKQLSVALEEIEQLKKELNAALEKIEQLEKDLQCQSFARGNVGLHQIESLERQLDSALVEVDRLREDWIKHLTHLAIEYEIDHETLSYCACEVCEEIRKALIRTGHLQPMCVNRCPYCNEVLRVQQIEHICNKEKSIPTGDGKCWECGCAVISGTNCCCCGAANGV